MELMLTAVTKIATGIGTLVSSAGAAGGAGGFGNILSAGGGLIGAAGSIAAGNAANKAAEYNALQLEAQAKTERAIAQRDAEEEQRNKRLVQSRARAVAAASGGGPDLNLLGQIEEEGTMRALTALWEGEERAKGRNAQAAGMRFEGQQEKRASRLRAARTLIGTATSFQERFG